MGHGGDPDQASLALLEMSSPSAGNARNDHTHERNAQLVADEAYARDLMAQMEREHQDEYGRALGSPPPPVAEHDREYTNLNYVPRMRNRFGQPVGSQQGLQNKGYSHLEGEEDARARGQDELDQLTEQFSKLADSKRVNTLDHSVLMLCGTCPLSVQAGKKTFNSFLSKAKDKYVQVQQQRAISGGESSEGQTSVPNIPPTTIAGFTLPSIPAPWQNNLNRKPNNPSNHLKSESPGMKESTMRDYSGTPTPLTRETNVSPQNLNKPSSTPNRLSSNSSTQPMRISSGSGQNGGANLSTSPTPAPATAAYSSSPSQLQRHRSNSNTGTGTSPAKVQMLPRQTISLLDPSKDGRSSSPAGGATASRRDVVDGDGSDEDDVEYVRNPFNDDD